MDQSKIEQYKEALLEKQKELLAEIGRLEQVTDFGSDVDHEEEEADEAEEYGNQLSVVETLKNRLTDIEMALNKIAAGKYGICEECGQEIPEEVLNVVPESKLCEVCKQK